KRLKNERKVTWIRPVSRIGSEDSPVQIAFTGGQFALALIVLSSGHNHRNGGRCFVLLVVCLNIPVLAQSPNVSGVVIDDRTEQPIRGVLIYIENQSSYTETDATGRFNVTVPRGRQTITASVIGYALLSTD